MKCKDCESVNDGMAKMLLFTAAMFLVAGMGFGSCGAKRAPLISIHAQDCDVAERLLSGAEGGE